MHAHNEMPKPMSDAKKDDDKGDLAPDVKKPMISGELDDSHMGRYASVDGSNLSPRSRRYDLGRKSVEEKMALLMKHKKMK
jgi:hypothetical protein